MGQYDGKNSFGAYSGFAYFFVVDGFVYTNAKFQPIELHDKHYSVTAFLTRACFTGAGHDVTKFTNDVSSGKAMSDEEWGTQLTTH